MYRPCKKPPLRAALVGVVVASVSTLTIAALEAREGGLQGERSDGWVRQHIRGVSFDFPTHIFSPASAENVGNAVVFFTPDRRAKIGVFGLESSGRDTPRSVLNRTAKFDSNRFTYIRTTSRFFAAAGTRRDMIFCRRCNFPTRDKERVACLHVDYPRSEKRAWDDVITRISLSLRVAR